MVQPSSAAEPESLEIVWTGRGLARGPAPPPRHQGGDPLGVPAVGGSDLAAQVTLLEPGAHRDVAARGDGEEEVPDAHPRGAPEGDQEPDHHRVADDPVQAARDERRRGEGVRRGGPPGLAQADELQVVDEEGRDDGQHPPGDEARPQDECPRPVDVPHPAADRLPEPEQQREAGDRGEDEHRPLERARQPALECPLHRSPRHDGVLEGEQQEQGEVCCDGEAGGHPHGPVDGEGNQRPAQERDGPRHDGDEGAVGQRGQDQVEESLSHSGTIAAATARPQPWNYLTSRPDRRTTRRSAPATGTPGAGGCAPRATRPTVR